ncbi:MAG: SDR family NAD(P)-dependent oxidoreductase, partial [Gemmiger sp.]
MRPVNVLITGGSRGIGAAAVLAFAREGCSVAFTWNTHEEAAQAVLESARRLAPAGARLMALRADVAESRQVQAAVLEAEAALGGTIQVLVCNAGIAQYGLFTDLRDEDWRRVMGVDLDGAFYCCRAVLPGMIRQKYGRILLVSSMWGQTGGSCEVAYSTAKAGLIG